MAMKEIWDTIKKIGGALGPAPTSPKEVSPARKALYEDIKKHKQVKK